MSLGQPLTENRKGAEMVGVEGEEELKEEEEEEEEEEEKLKAEEKDSTERSTSRRRTRGEEFHGGSEARDAEEVGGDSEE